MGSDWSVSTADPLAQIEVAVRWVDPHRRDDAPNLPEQSIPVSAALSAFTAGSAYVNHDDEAGWLAPGRRADIAVLGRNPFADPSGFPADAKVLHTVAAGAVVHAHDEGN